MKNEFSNNNFKEVLLEVITENSNDGIALLDEEYSIQYYNQKFKDILCSKNLGNGFNFLNLFSADDKTEIINSLHNSSIIKKDFFIRRENSSVAIELKIIKIDYKSLYVQITDISLKKLVAKAYNESEIKFQNFAENSLVGIYLIQNNTFKYCNPKLAKIFGYTIEEIMNHRSPRKIVHHQDYPKVKDSIKNRLLGLTKSINIEFRGIKKNGEIIDVEVFGTKTNYHGSPAIIGSLLDITERKTSLRDLKFRNEFELLITNISAKLINSKAHALKTEILKSLKQIGIFTGSQRAFIYLFNPEITKIHCVSIWKENNSHYNEKDYLEIDISKNKNWLKTLTEKKAYQINDVNKIPSSDPQLKSDMKKIGVISLIDVPVLHRGKLKGFLGLSNEKENVIYQESIVSLLKIAGEIFVNSIEREKTEQALIESEERYRGLYENSTLGIFRSTIDGKPLLANPAFLRMLGYRRFDNDFMNIKVKDIYKDENDRKRLLKLLFEKNSVNGFETVYKDRKGKFFDVRINAKLFKNEDCIYIEGIVEDITIKNKSELIFRKIAAGVSSSLGETFFNDLVHHLGETLNVNHVIVGELTDNGNYLKTLAAWDDGKIVDNFTYSIENTPCKNASTSQLCFYSENVQKKFPKDDFLRNKKIESYMGAPLITSDGNYIGIINICSKTEIENPELTKSILKIFAVRSTTELERLKTDKELINAKIEAENANELKSEFLAQVSHEIRTPINTILSFSNLIKDEVSEIIPDELSTHFHIMSNAGKRIIRTIDLILNMSEIQRGTYEMHPKKLNLLNDVIFPIKTEFNLSAKEKGLKIKINKKCSKSDVIADEYTISQIFNNLIDNAIKYTLKGSITISISKYKNGKVNVVIEDTGIGISSEYLPHLFNAFSQEEQGYTRKFEGNGLGLALVKNYCELNNVEITVKSKKNIGTKFKLLFNNIN